MIFQGMLIYLIIFVIIFYSKDGVVERTDERACEPGDVKNFTADNDERKIHYMACTDRYKV